MTRHVAFCARAVDAVRAVRLAPRARRHPTVRRRRVIGDHRWSRGITYGHSHVFAGRAAPSWQCRKGPRNPHVDSTRGRDGSPTCFRSSTRSRPTRSVPQQACRADRAHSCTRSRQSGIGDFAPTVSRRRKDSSARSRAVVTRVHVGSLTRDDVESTLDARPRLRARATMPSGGIAPRITPARTHARDDAGPPHVRSFARNNPCSRERTAPLVR